MVLRIGNYFISEFRGLGGGFWIQHGSGEGMQVSEKSLAELIDKFYKDNF